MKQIGVLTRVLPALVASAALAFGLGVAPTVLAAGLDTPPGVTGPVVSTGTQSGTITEPLKRLTEKSGDDDLTITTDSLFEAIDTPPTGGKPYDYQLQATGGHGTLTWAMSGNPSWLHLTSSGELHGTPNHPGEANNITFTVTDSNNSTATATFGLTVVNDCNGNIKNVSGESLDGDDCDAPEAPYTFVLVGGLLASTAIVGIRRRRSGTEVN